MTMEQINFSFRSSVFSVLKTLCVKASQNKLDLLYDVDHRIPGWSFLQSNQAFR